MSVAIVLSRPPVVTSLLVPPRRPLHPLCPLPLLPALPDPVLPVGPSLVVVPLVRVLNRVTPATSFVAPRTGWVTVRRNLVLSLLGSLSMARGMTRPRVLLPRTPDPGSADIASRLPVPWTMRARLIFLATTRPTVAKNTTAETKTPRIRSHHTLSKSLVSNSLSLGRWYTLRTGPSSAETRIGFEFSGGNPIMGPGLIVPPSSAVGTGTCTRTGVAGGSETTVRPTIPLPNPRTSGSR